VPLNVNNPVPGAPATEYQTSPLTVVAVVIPKVVESTPKLVATPKFGVDAAIVDPVKLSATNAINAIKRFFM